MIQPGSAEIPITYPAPERGLDFAAQSGRGITLSEPMSAQEDALEQAVDLARQEGVGIIVGEGADVRCWLADDQSGRLPVWSDEDFMRFGWGVGIDAGGGISSTLGSLSHFSPGTFVLQYAGMRAKLEPLSTKHPETAVYGQVGIPLEQVHAALGVLARVKPHMRGNFGPKQEDLMLTIVEHYPLPPTSVSHRPEIRKGKPRRANQQHVVPLYGAYDYTPGPGPYYGLPAGEAPELIREQVTERLEKILPEQSPRLATEPEGLHFRDGILYRIGTNVDDRGREQKYRAPLGASPYEFASVVRTIEHAIRQEPTRAEKLGTRVWLQVYARAVRDEVKRRKVEAAASASA